MKGQSIARFSSKLRNFPQTEHGFLMRTCLILLSLVRNWNLELVVWCDNNKYFPMYFLEKVLIWFQAMPWPSAPLRFAVLLLAATVGPPGTLGEGNVGEYTLSFLVLCIRQTTGWKLKQFDLSASKEKRGTRPPVYKEIMVLLGNTFVSCI